MVAVRAEHGQAIVEFAIVAPLLLLVVVGVLSFGRAMNYNEQATHLVNEAARYAMVNQVPAGGTGTLGQWVRAQADSAELRNGTGSVLGIPQVCVSYASGTSNGVAGASPPDAVTIKMSFTFYWATFLKLKPASTTITRTATMLLESAPTGAFFAAGCS